MDEGSYAIWKEGSVKVDLSERANTPINYKSTGSRITAAASGENCIFVRLEFKEIAPFPHSMSDSPTIWNMFVMLSHSILSGCFHPGG